MAVSQDDPITELKGIVNKLTNKVDNRNKQLGLGAMKEHSSSDRPTGQASARPKNTSISDSYVKSCWHCRKNDHVRL